MPLPNGNARRLPGFAVRTARDRRERLSPHCRPEPCSSLTFALRGLCGGEGLCFQQTDRKGLAYNRSMPGGKISGWTWMRGGG
jgi:hypothetical protein